MKRILTSNIEVILQMARSLDIGLILSNHCLKDLDVNGTNLLPTVQTKTRLRQIFGVADSEEIKKLVDVSGETTFLTRAFSRIANSVFPFFSILQESHQETISPRLRVNDIVEATDQPGRSIFVLRRGEGSAQFRGLPFIMESVFHISPELYRMRQNAPWPAESDSAKIITQPFEEPATTIPDEHGQVETLSPQAPPPKPSKPSKNSRKFKKTSNSPDVAPEVIDDFLSALDNFRDNT